MCIQLIYQFTNMVIHIFIYAYDIKMENNKLKILSICPHQIVQHIIKFILLYS